VPSDQTLRLELARSTRGMFNLIHHASRFNLDPAVGRVLTQVVMQKNRTRVITHGVPRQMVSGQRPDLGSKPIFTSRAMMRCTLGR